MPYPLCMQAALTWPQNRQVEDLFWLLEFSLAWLVSKTAATKLSLSLCLCISPKVQQESLIFCDFFYFNQSKLAGFDNNSNAF